MNPTSGSNFQDWEPVVFKAKPIKTNYQGIPKPKIDDDEIKIKKINRDLQVALQKARLAKKLSQKDVAQRMNVKSSDIMNYENGKAIPNNAFISKLEKFYQVKLPRAK
tara:strand:- start:2461 stop:2784 length:324 start_codon:yes stop_codon:yes gene_type:complete